MKRASKTQYPLTVEVSTAKQRLQLEIVRRKVVEASLKKSREHYAQLLAQSRVTQEQLRSLSHKIILAQEKERKHISRELHDEISQILTALNIRLSALKIEAAANVGNLKKKAGNRATPGRKITDCRASFCARIAAADAG